ELNKNNKLNFVSQADNLTGQTSNLTGQTSNLTANNGELNRNNKLNFVSQADNLTGQADNLTGQADNLTGQADNLTGQADNLTANNGELNKNNKLNFVSQTSNFTGQTSNFTGQTSNLTGQTSNLTGQDSYEGEAFYILIKSVNNKTDFVPDKVTLTEGSKVIWLNYDTSEHTITVESGSKSGYPLLNSLILPNGMVDQEFQSVGTYHYSDLDSPQSNGVITILDSAQKEDATSIPLEE
ncbi:MAG: hypothetical protein ACM31M_05400, partial [Nitrososphaerota archaeon]